MCAPVLKCAPKTKTISCARPLGWRSKQGSSTWATVMTNIAIPNNPIVYNQEKFPPSGGFPLNENMGSRSMPAAHSSGLRGFQADGVPVKMPKAKTEPNFAGIAALDKTSRLERRSRRGNHTGTLRTRGNLFYAKWHYKGKEFERSTGIHTYEQNAKQKALKKLDAFTAPYRLASEMDLLTFFKMKIQTLAQKVLEANIRGNELTLRELYLAFQKSPRRRPMKESSLLYYENLLYSLVEEFGADKTMGVITPYVANEYAKKLELKLANGTFNNYISRLAYAWDVLAPHNESGINPWRGICMKPLDCQARQPLTDDEVQRLMSAAKGIERGEAKLLLTIGANTGMRISDCIALKWGNVDLEGRFIRNVKTVKTGANISVPLLKELREALESIPRRSDDKTVLRRLCDRAKADAAMRAVFAKAGLETNIVRKKGERARPYKTFHSLRSTFVTKCAEAGISLEIVKAVVGHATVNMTEHYTHIREKAIKEAFDKAGLE